MFHRLLIVIVVALLAVPGIAAAQIPAPATTTTTLAAPANATAPAQKSFLDEDAEAPGQVPEGPGLAQTLLRLALALAFIFALLVGGLILFQRVARRGIKLPGAGDRPLHVVDRVSLGPKQGVVLLNACGRRLLIGVSEKEMTVLTELDAQADAGDFKSAMDASDSGRKAGN